MAFECKTLGWNRYALINVIAIIWFVGNTYMAAQPVPEVFLNLTETHGCCPGFRGENGTMCHKPEAWLIVPIQGFQWLTTAVLLMLAVYPHHIKWWLNGFDDEWYGYPDRHNDTCLEETVILLLKSVFLLAVAGIVVVGNIVFGRAINPMCTIPLDNPMIQEVFKYFPYTSSTIVIVAIIPSWGGVIVLVGAIFLQYVWSYWCECRISKEPPKYTSRGEATAV